MYQVNGWLTFVIFKLNSKKIKKLIIKSKWTAEGK